MLLSQQVESNVIITDKIGRKNLADELPNDVRLKKISKLHGIIVSIVLHKMKILSMLARNYYKQDIELSY